MESIADSDAIFDASRILPQHQTALTLLNRMLQKPANKSINWLDVACGKGQIISQLGQNLTEDHRGKMRYVGFDININHAQKAETLASKLKLSSYEFLSGNLANLDNILEPNWKFDFITCTNTAHELQPGAFASLILTILSRLSDTGELYIYDMESLAEPELGAVPWRCSEIDTILNTVFEVLETDFRLHPVSWTHRTCLGWSVTIERQDIKKTDMELKGARKSISERLEQEISRILDARFSDCNKSLEAFCNCGVDTGDEAKQRVSALFEFWALYRAKEMRK